MTFDDRVANDIKPEFEERMLKLLNGDKDDYQKFRLCISTHPLSSIRCNTLKITPDALKKKLESKGWKIHQYSPDNPEIMIILNDLQPGEIGRAEEHLLGYYYVQEISSMLPLLALKPQPGEKFFDCCAAPGSKTTQAAALMDNSGMILANDNSLGRIKVLASNLERCGVVNTIVSREDGLMLGNKLANRSDLRFDKVLADVPCTGEGTLRSSPSSAGSWSLKAIESFSKRQMMIAESALRLLKVGGLMVYSTCTHGPEENEVVVNYLLNNFDVELVPFNLPLKTRPGITEWGGVEFHPSLKYCARVYPHDNNTEGFFVSLIKKNSDNKNVGWKK